MIGLAAAAAILLTPTPRNTDGPRGPLSVVVHATGARDVSYAIDVHNTTDRPVADAVITQQLPPGLNYRAATPPARRTGRRLTWTLAIPAHGTTRIVTTTVGAARHHLGARPLDPVTQAGTVHHGEHGAHDQRPPTTTVCAGEDTGPQNCVTGRGELRVQALSHWERTALAIGAAGAAVALAAWLGPLRSRRRRRAAGALERAGVEG